MSRSCCFSKVTFVEMKRDRKRREHFLKIENSVQTLCANKGVKKKNSKNYFSVTKTRFLSASTWNSASPSDRIIQPFNFPPQYGNPRGQTISPVRMIFSTGFRSGVPLASSRQRQLRQFIRKERQSRTSHRLSAFGTAQASRSSLRHQR